MKKMPTFSAIAVAVAIVCSVPTPAHAASPAAVALASTSMTGSWGNGMRLDPQSLAISLSGHFTGVASVGTSPAIPGDVACTGLGDAVESVALGSGSMSLSCSGGFSLGFVILSGSHLVYQRVGTEAVVEGPVALNVNGAKATVNLAFHYTIQIQQVWAPAPVPGGGIWRGWAAYGQMASAG